MRALRVQKLLAMAHCVVKMEQAKHSKHQVNCMTARLSDLICTPLACLIMKPHSITRLAANNAKRYIWQCIARSEVGIAVVVASLETECAG